MRAGSGFAIGAVAPQVAWCAWRAGVNVADAPSDPRKDAVQSGVAMVMRGLLQTMFNYCEGPPSTPEVEAELGARLVEAGRVLQRYGRHVARGAVGNVGMRRQ
jgi:hypothetical protein